MSLAHVCPKCGRSWFVPTRCGDCDVNTVARPATPATGDFQAAAPAAPVPHLVLFRETMQEVADRLDGLREMIESDAQEAQRLVRKAERCIERTTELVPEITTWWEEHCQGADEDLEEALTEDLLVDDQVNLEDFSTIADHLRKLARFGREEGAGEDGAGAGDDE